MGWKADWARSRGRSKRRFALVWIPLGVVFALLADWPWGLLIIPLGIVVAGFLWAVAAAEERTMLRTFEKYGEAHPVTSWTALGRWMKERASRSR